MLSEAQKNVMAELIDGDTQLLFLLVKVSKYISAPKILVWLYKEGIKGQRLKTMLKDEYDNDPEKIVKGLNKKISLC